MAIRCGCSGRFRREAFYPGGWSVAFRGRFPFSTSSVLGEFRRTSMALASELKRKNSPAPWTELAGAQSTQGVRSPPLSAILLSRPSADFGKASRIEPAGKKNRGALPSVLA